MIVTMETNFGTMRIELDFANTPKSAENFLNYVKSGFYEGTIFHRVINNFMIQGGGFTEEMSSKPTQAAIENEAASAKPNIKGSVAMARTSDPHSATSQFFINVVDNNFLNHTKENASGWGYCVFGQVVEGMDVVDKIKQIPTTSKAGHDDVPQQTVLIEKVYVEEDAMA